MCSSHSHFEPLQRGQSLRASFLMRKADSAQSMKLWVAMPIDAETELQFLAPPQDAGMVGAEHDT